MSASVRGGSRSVSRSAPARNTLRAMRIGPPPGGQKVQPDDMAARRGGSLACKIPPRRREIIAGLGLCLSSSWSK